jgi:hypothetical protein
MPRLPENPTMGEVRAFLAAVEPQADRDQPAKLNRAFSRQQIWDVFMAPVSARTGPDSEPAIPPYSRTWPGIINNINREFGSRVKEIN